MIKKVLAFVALFGIGLAILVGFDRRGSTHPNRVQGIDANSAQSSIEGIEGVAGLQMIVRGELHIDQFTRTEGGGGERRLSLDAVDSRPASEG